jgi:hypothetical protein
MTTAKDQCRSRYLLYQVSTFLDLHPIYLRNLMVLEYHKTSLCRLNLGQREMTIGESLHSLWSHADIISQTEKGSPCPILKPNHTRSSFSGDTLPVPEAMPSPPPASTLSTWVPDGSLRFVNPHYLSPAEKQLLENQRDVQGAGKRKECTDDSCDHGDVKKVDKDVEEVEEKRPKKMGRPLPITQDDSAIPTPAPLHMGLFEARERPSTFESTFRHMATHSSRPFRGTVNEMDLLRQVKSNNLSIPQPSNPQTQAHVPSRPQHQFHHGPPNMNWQPPGKTIYSNIHHYHQQYKHHHHQSQHQYQVQHQHQLQPLRATQPPSQQPHNKSNDPFTYAPLLILPQLHPTSIARTATPITLEKKRDPKSPNPLHYRRTRYILVIGILHLVMSLTHHLVLHPILISWALPF